MTGKFVADAMRFPAMSFTAPCPMSTKTPPPSPPGVPDNLKAPARAVSDKLNVMANPSSATTLKATTESNNREGQRGAERGRERCQFHRLGGIPVPTAASSYRGAVQGQKKIPRGVGDVNRGGHDIGVGLRKERHRGIEEAKESKEAKEAKDISTLHCAKYRAANVLLWRRWFHWHE